MTGVIFGYTRNELLTMRNALIVYKAQAIKILGDVLQAMVDLENPYQDPSQGGH